MSKPALILASRSPRRKQLLQQAGVAFTAEAADVDEAVLPGELPADYVRRLSRLKAETVSRSQPSALVLGADTAVVADGLIYGKPREPEEARRTLRRLSGGWHAVLTGVALIRRTPAVEQGWVCRTRVRFKPLTDREICRYCQLVDTMDKAGGYAIQEYGNLLVAEVDGLTSNVIGLPVEEVAEALGGLCGWRDA